MVSVFKKNPCQISWTQQRSFHLEKAISVYLCAAVESLKKTPNPSELRIRDDIIDQARLNVFLEVVFKVVHYALVKFGKGQSLGRLVFANDLAKQLLQKHKEILKSSTSTKMSFFNLTEIAKNPHLSLSIKLGIGELQRFQFKLYHSELSRLQACLRKRNNPQDDGKKVFDSLPAYLKQQLLEAGVKRGYSKKSLHSNLNWLVNKSHGKTAIIQEIKGFYEKSSTTCHQWIQQLIDASATCQDPSQMTCAFDVSTDRLTQRTTDKLLSTPISVVMVGVEYTGLIKEGGLAEALEGMSKGLKQQHPGNQVSLVFPKVNILPQRILQQLKDPQVKVTADGIEYKIYTYEQEGVKCHFIEHDSIHLPEGHHSIYGPDNDVQNERFAAFNALAADYIHSLKKVDVIHLHDWHVAAVGLKLKKDFASAKKRKEKPPAVVFTYHNNAVTAQGLFGAGEGGAGKGYQYAANASAFAKWKLIADSDHINLFTSILKEADAVTTVSETFGIESQNMELGEGVSFMVKEAAKAGKLFGIINGNDPKRWDPENDTTLRNWKDITTQTPLDISYGPHHPDILSKKQECKRQLQQWVEKYMHSQDGSKFVKLDSDKPFVTYIGRFDSRQKGLHRFEKAIESTLKNGGQFICMGTTEDKNATQILDALEKKYAGQAGVWFIRDYKDENNDNRLFFQQGNQDRPGIGSLVRAATDFIFMPSDFEPCGLTYREGFGYGSLAICSNVGGPVDLIISRENDLQRFNGYLFKKEGDELSNLAGCADTLKEALQFWHSQSPEDKNAYMKRLMETARKDSWVTSPQKYSPVDKYRMVYEYARRQSIVSKTSYVAEVVKIMSNPTVSYQEALKENYLLNHHKAKEFGLSSEELEKLYSALPQEVKKDVPTPYGVNVNTSLYDEFGALYKRSATTFSVFAPKAESVSVVLYTDDEEIKAEYPLQSQENGQWKTTVKYLHPGQRYQYKINGEIKIDPYGRRAIPSKDVQKAPYSAIVDPKAEVWTDGNWMAARTQQTYAQSPISIYEVHPTTWKKSDGHYMNYREFAVDLVEHVKKTGFTHVELMGLLEHPDERSWGYQVTGYFAPNHRMGSVEDFKYFINYLHEHGVGVILDFVPGHFASDKYALHKFNGSNLYEPNSWESIWSIRRWFYNFGAKHFDYRKRETREMLISSAHYWLKEMHLDGIRVDCIGGILHSESRQHSELFLKDLNVSIHQKHSGIITIAEDFSGHSALLGRGTRGDLGFHSRWNVGWNFIVKQLLAAEPNQRQRILRHKKTSFMSDHHNHGINFLSHDEFADKTDRTTFKRLIQHSSHPEIQKDWKSLIAMQMTAPGKKLVFSGVEFASPKFWHQFIGTSQGIMNGEFNQFQQNLLNLTKYLNDLYKQEKALHDDKNSTIEWINDPSAQLYAYRRSVDNSSIAVFHNLTDKPSKEFVVTIPKKEGEEMRPSQIIATDDPRFGGGEVRGYIQGIKYFEDRVEYRIKVPAQTTIIIRER